jgi:tol-pal system beta propeller repeat protein TolB
VQAGSAVSKDYVSWMPIHKRGSRAALTCASLLAAAVRVGPRATTGESFPGGNGRIAFVQEGPQRGIYTIDASGSNLTRLTRGEDYRPRWSPDGTRIVFQRFSPGSIRSDVFVMNADGSGLQPLTQLGTTFQPAWSPDGTRIVFGNGLGHKAEIFVMNADGTNQTQLTHDRFEDSVPAWSPDGTTIAFASRRHHNADIYLMSPDGSDQRRLTHVRRKDENPDWSPDGSRIVFQSNRHNRPGNFDLYAIHPDGSGIERLTSNLATEWAPAWSPDGSMIAFTIARYDRGVEDIATLTLGSPVMVRFVIPHSVEFEPNWQATSQASG